MFRDLKIFNKVFISHAAVGLISVFTLSAIFYFLFQQAIFQRTIDQLSSINILKKNQIDDYFKATQQDLQFYLAQDFALTNSDFNTQADHDPVKKKITALQQQYDFKNVIVADQQHQIIATTSAVGSLVEYVSGLPHNEQKVFQAIEVTSGATGKDIVIVYMLPIVTKDQAVMGYLFIEENFEKIQTILLELTGMGNTGESYLVGKDLRMRSLSRFKPHTPPSDIIVDTPSTRNAFAGEYKGEIITDYRGVSVLSFSRSIDYAGLHWALVSEIDVEEAMLPVRQSRDYIVMATAAIIMIIFVITFFISNAISRPILYLNTIITDLSKGIITPKKIDVTDQSEVGQIAQATEALINGLKRTAVFADEIGSGDFNASFKTLSDQDTIGLALIHMRDRLKSLTEEQVRLLREKTSLLLEGQELERRRIVAELHDGVGQLLTVTRLQVEMIESDTALRQEILKLLNETIQEVKRISYAVMPNAIVDFGLEAALRGLCENSSKYASLAIDFNYVRESDHTINFETNIAIFRIIQEGLHNIIKHADARNVDLHIVDEARQFYFMLKDDGIGFDEEKISHMGLGLQGMRERAQLLGGTLNIYTAVGQGTVIDVVIPL